MGNWPFYHDCISRMKTVIPILVVFFFLCSFAYVFYVLERSSSFVNRIKKYHYSEYERLGWREMHTNKEGFHEEQVMPYIESGEYLSLNDSRLNNLALNITSKTINNLDMLLTTVMLIVIVIGVLIGVINA